VYGPQTDFGLFFAYIFNIPGKGALSSELVNFFEGDLVSVGGKSKKAAKMGIGSYKGQLQKSLSSSRSFPSNFPRQAVGTFDVRLTVAIDERMGQSVSVKKVVASRWFIHPCQLGRSPAGHQRVTRVHLSRPRRRTRHQDDRAPGNPRPKAAPLYLQRCTVRPDYRVPDP
jgi:hypothetical protein